MANLNPYLNFNGNTKEAFDFYRSVFGGEFATVMRYGEMPAGEGMPPVPDQAKDLITHIALPIGDTVLMGSDVVEGFGPPFQQGNNFNVSISTESKEEADRLYNGLAAGGQVVMPMADAFWGAYFGMLVDKFGINWMISSGNKM